MGLFSRLYIGCQTRDGNLEFFRHENQAFPQPLSNDGSLHLGAKSNLMVCVDMKHWKYPDHFNLKLISYSMGGQVSEMLASTKGKPEVSYSGPKVAARDAAKTATYLSIVLIVENRHQTNSTNQGSPGTTCDENCFPGRSYLGSGTASISCSTFANHLGLDKDRGLSL